VFTPDEVAGVCKVRSRKMFATATEGESGFVSYSFPISINPVTLYVGRPQTGSPLFGSADCSWRLTYEPLEIDEEFAITHIDGHVNCLKLPDFSFAIDYPFGDETCPGTITFEQFSYQKIPYKARWPVGQEETITLDTQCGSCTEACYILAVKRGNASNYDYIDAVEECEEFVWNDEEQGWKTESEFIEHIEVEGVCYIKLTTWATETLQGDLIAIDECAVGMVLTFKDELGNWVQISCNLCHCWEHICGECRCICETVCLLGIDDGAVLGPYEAQWNSRLFRWETGITGVPLIGVGKNLPSDDCQVTVEGFESVDLDNNCGDAVSFTVINSEEDQEENGLRLWIGFCKACEGSCDGGTCLSDCEDVPQILYATVSPLPWTPMLGCEGYPASDCFEEFVIPLVQMFIPTLLNPAGEWRWIGAMNFQCRGCDTGGNPGDAEYRTTLAMIDIGCDGLGSLSVTGINRGGTSRTVVVDLEFDLPCNGYGSWTDLEVGEEVSGSDMLCCNNGAGWKVTLTDVAP
jgi:hypothetical protein